MNRDSKHILEQRDYPQPLATPVLSLRMPVDLLQRIDNWRIALPKPVRRSDAVRILLSQALDGMEPGSAKKLRP